MSAGAWTLLDVERELFVESLVLGPKELGAAAGGCRVTLRTLRGGRSEGLQLLEVDNGAFRFALLPGRGMGLWRAWHGDDPIGWRSPVQGPVHPCYVPIAEPSGLGWLDGFDELLVRCGLSSFGAPEHSPDGKLLWPLHGRIANLPAHRLDVSIDAATGEISVTGVVDECRFLIHNLRLTSTLRTRPGESGVRIHDVVENRSGKPAEMQLLYHINFGPPLLEPQSKVVVPAAEVAPRDATSSGEIETWETYGPPRPGSTERAYFTTLRGDRNGATQVLLKNARGDRGVSLGFDVNQLPCFSLWKNTIAEADGYVTGLEPGTSYPNGRSHEVAQKRFVTLAPGAKAQFDMALQYHATAESVRTVEGAIASLAAAGGPPKVHPAPRPGWSVGA